MTTTELSGMMDMLQDSDCPDAVWDRLVEVERLEREMTRLEHDFGFCNTHEERADNESRWAALREELGR